MKTPRRTTSCPQALSRQEILHHYACEAVYFSGDDNASYERHLVFDHMPSWDAAAADAVWTEACGKERWHETTNTLAQDIRGLSDARLWQLRRTARVSLVTYARERLAQQLAAAGASPEAVARAQHLFDADTLTLGFARCFATYKRPNLLLHDPERLWRLMTNPHRLVQLIMAGKAHPADQAGQALIQQWTRFIRQPEIRPHAIFLSDYDMLVTEHLVQRRAA
jgi:starch phosphorylase